MQGTRKRGILHKIKNIKTTSKICCFMSEISAADLVKEFFAQDTKLSFGNKQNDFFGSSFIQQNNHDLFQNDSFKNNVTGSMAPISGLNHFSTHVSNNVSNYPVQDECNTDTNSYNFSIPPFSSLKAPELNSFASGVPSLSDFKTPNLDAIKINSQSGSTPFRSKQTLDGSDLFGKNEPEWLWNGKKGALETVANFTNASSQQMQGSDFAHGAVLDANKLDNQIRQMQQSASVTFQKDILISKLEEKIFLLEQVCI